MAPEQSMGMASQASLSMYAGPGMMMQPGGHLYMQTNELRNVTVACSPDEKPIDHD